MTCPLCHDKGYTAALHPQHPTMAVLTHCTCPAGQAFKQQSKPREGEEMK